MSIIRKQNSTATLVKLCTQRINALNTEVSAKAAISINGTATKVPTVIATYQAYLDQQAALTAKKAELTQALKARDAALLAVEADDAGLNAWVASQFGLGSQQAETFGFAPKTRQTVTSTKRVAAHQQSLATRAARGTMGKRQRLSIKGVVPAPASASSGAVPPSASTAPVAASSGVTTQSPPPTASNAATPSRS